MKMPKTTRAVLVLLLGLVVLLGANYFFRPFYQQLVETEPVENSTVFFASESASLSAVDLVFNRFSQQDKIGQILAWPVEISAAGELETGALTEQEFLLQLSKKKPGTFTLFGDRISSSSARAAIDLLSSYNGSVLPAWIAVDHEGGRVQRLNGEGFTKLASWRSFCGADRSKAEQVLVKSALELKEVGVDVVLAPVLDVGLPSVGLGDRLCSNNPEVVIDRVGLYLSTFKAQEILPVAKHFPGTGKVAGDLHQQFIIGRVGVEDVLVYRSILDKDSALGVMTSHLGLENQYAHVPCSLSPDCVGELLENYPQVLVFADALEMKSAAYLPESSRSAQKTELTLAEVSQKAVLAGNDVLLYGPGVSFEQMNEVYDMLNRAYLSDPVFREKLDQSVKKIIGYKLGLTIHAIETAAAQSE